MLITYKNANIYQRHGIEVLHGVNFEVDEGEMVYIIGRVGSGKSTLLKTIYCDLDIDEADEATVERRNDRIAEVLSMVGLEDKADKMPNELSGGEQQRVAIARSILNQPQIIIADEPTGNLDKETADNIMQLLKSIADKGTAVIMSTHNISLVNKYPGKAFQCQDGKMEQVVIRKAEPKAEEVKE